MRFIGERLKVLRESKRLTLVQLGELSGIAAGYISQVEHSKKNPGPEK